MTQPSDRAASDLSDRAVANLRLVVERPETTDGRYDVHEQIGRGGMGVVFRAHDTRLARDVALKVLTTANTSSTASERLTREARILATLEHPGIVPVHDTGQLVDGRAFYVMRLVRGVRLDTHAMSGAGRGELLRIMLRLCETVAFAHAHGVVHRDLKPGNVMIGPFGDVLVLDWGAARLRSASEYPARTPPDTSLPALPSPVPHGETTGDGVVIGTPGYMAPEQAAGDSAHVDARADVFGLGAILRDLLERADASTASNTTVPHALRAIVARCMAESPDDRYESAVALALDLRHWLDGEAVSAYREGPLERAGRFYRRHEVAVLLIVAYIVVRSAIVFWRRP